MLRRRTIVLLLASCLLLTAAPSNLNAFAGGAGESSPQARGDGQVPPAWFNIRTYGATPGDDSDDDGAAINAAIAAFNAAGRGRLYVPAGDYYTPRCNLTAITANGIVFGDGHTDSNSPSIGTNVSRIRCGSATAVLFTVNSNSLTFRDLALTNTARATPTAGAGIRVTNRTNPFQQVSYESISVERFYDLLDIEVGNNWVAFNCWFRAPVRYGAHIRNLLLPDTGGWAVIKSSFVSDTGRGVGIRVRSCGGAKILATNILGMAQAVVADLSSGHTGIMTIGAGCNFENLTGIPIEITDWHSVKILGVEFGMWDVANVEAIKLTGVKNGQILGCAFNAPRGGDYAINLVNCEGVKVADMDPGGYHHLTNLSGTWEPYTSGNAGNLKLTLQNGWSNAAGWAPSTVALVGNEIRLTVNISGGRANTKFAELPVYFRPKAKRRFTAHVSGGGSCGVVIDTNGDMTQVDAPNNGHMSLEVSFRP